MEKSVCYNSPNVWSNQTKYGQYSFSVSVIQSMTSLSNSHSHMSQNRKYVKKKKARENVGHGNWKSN